MKERGLTAESLKKAQKEMGMWYGVSFVVALITAYVLAHVMLLSENFFHYPMLSTGIISAFWMWLGFVMPVQVTATIFGDRKSRLSAIDCGFQLVSVLTMGVVIATL